ncbi:[FeFe] hydrogenase, group B1/B3 [Natronincola peptidivorans]|uniref:[FeFe] hydrogenase, group B1/B3 n=1 Tax=Natronincola peptidivorans TaxID=426128 RepID=A0A1I0C8D3_9FIRM|nr:4Fe-4S dicluster domain-containing protein [Natronincola peptidivorans]SET15348.1 [FeFe] hydrogenase, group B1/B3 [Natronincola peptidivorans]
MRRFETDVQLIKYEVLKEVARYTLEGTLEKNFHKIPKKIDPGPRPRIRCCIHKERAITVERVKLAMGGDKDNKNEIEVINAACDECPINRFTITEACRGCLAHRCIESCPVKAIYQVGKRAYINPEKCIECGKCKSVCPFNAISDVMRPCKKACHVSALYIDEEKIAVIDNEKCVQCGSCVYQCPFGAIMDKSYIVDVIELLKKAKAKDELRVYAVIAPAISSQFTYVRIGQVVKGIKLLGFHDVVEAALGADMIAYNETLELAHRLKSSKVMTSSCCPAFVAYIQKHYPSLIDKVSDSVSPMVAVARLIKSMDENAKVVFIGPCTAKKAEAKESHAVGSVDYVITFEELCAMIDAMDIRLEDCEDALLDNASYYGRIFARTGGLAKAVEHVVEAEKLDIECKPISCDGLAECDKVLKLIKADRLKGNFVEGMACFGGCIGGAASLHHGPKDRNEVDKYGQLAIEKEVKDSLRVFDLDSLNLTRD